MSPTGLIAVAALRDLSRDKEKKPRLFKVYHKFGCYDIEITINTGMGNNPKNSTVQLPCHAERGRVSDK